VIEGTYQVIEDAKKMIESASQMSSIRLNEDEKKYFAQAAHTLRFENSPIGKEIEPLRLLNPRRREEENKNDLFTIFNIAQENIMKGKLRIYKVDNYRGSKRFSTRGINSIDENLRLNRALWTVAEKMMALKNI
jgi:hypothetical protein